MAAYDALDISEIAAESVRVNSKTSTQENNTYVRYPSGQGTGEGNSFITLRFLPRRKGEHLFCSVKYHFLKDSNGNRKIFFSPKKLTKTEKGDYRWVGENTVIDKYLRDLWAKSEKVTGKAQEDFRNQYREIKGIERYYYNVIVRQEKDPKTGEIIKNSGPKILSCGNLSFNKRIIAMMIIKSAFLRSPVLNVFGLTSSPRWFIIQLNLSSNLI
jgi:hypothetical protein